MSNGELFEGYPFLQWMWRYFPVVVIISFVILGVFMSVALSIANGFIRERGAT